MLVELDAAVVGAASSVVGAIDLAVDDDKPLPSTASHVDAARDSFAMLFVAVPMLLNRDHGCTSLEVYVSPWAPSLRQRNLRVNARDPSYALVVDEVGAEGGMIALFQPKAA